MVVSAPEEGLSGVGFSQPTSRRPLGLGGNETWGGGWSAASASGTLLPGGLTSGPAHFCGKGCLRGKTDQ